MNVTSKKIMSRLCEIIHKEWAGECGAKVSIADDPGHAVDLLTAGQSGGCAVVIFYMSDTQAVSGIPGNTVLDANIRVGIVQKTGLEVRAGNRASPVLDKVDGLRKFLAGHSDMEGLLDPLEYTGMTPIQVSEGRALNGYALNYRARYAFDV